MRIVYIYSGDWEKKQVEVLSKFGIKVDLGADKFEIDKGPLHEEILPYLAEWGYVKDRGVGTFYNKKELNQAKHLVYRGSWTNGYPQPDDTFEWMDIVYDKSAFCNHCGTGLIQKAPFRLRKPPNWNNRHIFELEWVYDEIFVKKETYETLYKPMGIECWPVLLYKKEKIIEDTVQLKIPVVNVPLDLKDQRYVLCSQCGIKKYINQIEGLFPPFVGKEIPDYPIFKSIEYCGTGYRAEKWVFLTQELRQKSIDYGVKAIYMPLAE